MTGLWAVEMDAVDDERADEKLQRKIARKFKELDQDGDGLVTLAEFLVAAGFSDLWQQECGEREFGYFPWNYVEQMEVDQEDQAEVCEASRLTFLLSFHEEY
jgi:hypothetical protein